MSDRTYPARPIVSVGAVVFEGDRVLLVRRAHEPLKGEWSLPGGAVELGETLEAAVAREVFEETGLRIDVGPLVEAVDRVHRDADGCVEYHYVVVDYLCRARSNRLVPGSDADDVRWAGLGELPAYRLNKKAAAVVQKAFNMRS